MSDNVKVTHPLCYSALDAFDALINEDVIEAEVEDDETIEPIGYQCFLCKRDLSYTPGGLIDFLPPNTFGVAILSCGHTFHTYCLQTITPEQDCRDPPCIPCALALE